MESLRDCGRLSIFACCYDFSLLLLFFLFEGGGCVRERRHDWLNRWWVLWVSVFLLMLFWVCVVSSFLCQGLAPRVLRLMISDVKSFKEYGIQFEKVGNEERCYVHCWEGTYLKKICVSSQTLDQKVPDAELVLLARVVTCFEGEQLPVSILGASPSLVRVLDDKRSDGRRFMMWQSFSEEVFLQCFRQSHQDVFGMLEVTTALE